MCLGAVFVEGLACVPPSCVIGSTWRCLRFCFCHLADSFAACLPSRTFIRVFTLALTWLCSALAQHQEYIGMKYIICCPCNCS